MNLYPAPFFDHGRTGFISDLRPPKVQVPFIIGVVTSSLIARGNKVYDETPGYLGLNLKGGHEECVTAWI
jgi:hypothetical protein